MPHSWVPKTYYTRLGEGDNDLILKLISSNFSKKPNLFPIKFTLEFLITTNYIFSILRLFSYSSFTQSDPFLYLFNFTKVSKGIAVVYVDDATQSLLKTHKLLQEYSKSSCFLNGLPMNTEKISGTSLKKREKMGKIYLYCHLVRRVVLFTLPRT